MENDLGQLEPTTAILCSQCHKPLKLSEVYAGCSSCGNEHPDEDPTIPSEEE